MSEDSNDSKLEQVPGGHRCRLRYGANQRQRFIIKLTDREQAQRRYQALQALASVLSKAGKGTEAPIILRKGAGAQSEKDFQDLVRFVEGLCETKVEPQKLTPRSSFKKFADQGTSGDLT